MSTYIVNFPNCGYIDHTFLDQDLEPIRSEISNIEQKFETYDQVDHTFTSTVKKEYVIKESFDHLSGLVLPFVGAYLNHFNIEDSDSDAYLHSAWVNFQAKQEFFAPHTHKGAFSFVLYLQVPFTIEQEKEYLSSNNKQVSTTTSFNFFYNDALGEIKPHSIPVDKTWENKMIFFPGRMLHSVNPFFSSDKYRIAVSGNIRYK